MDAVTKPVPNLPPDLKVRDAVPQDIPFISSTWKQNFWKESPWANRIRWAQFQPGHDRVVQRLLGRSRVLVACDTSIEDAIAGYLVFELGPKVAHWAYVKPVFRKVGILRALLAASELPHGLDGVTVTHGTRAWFSAPPLLDKPGGREVKPGKVGLEARFPGAIHDPYSWVNP